MRSPPWSRVKLRVAFGDVPEPSDILEFRTGRRYQVLIVRGKTLHCLVLPADAEADGRVLPWEWAPRKRRTH